MITIGRRLLAGGIAAALFITSCTTASEHTQAHVSRLSDDQIDHGMALLRDSEHPQIANASLISDPEGVLYTATLINEDLQTSEVWTVRFIRHDSETGTAIVNDSTGTPRLVIDNTADSVTFSDGSGHVLATIDDPVTFVADRDAQLQLAQDVGMTLERAAAFEVYSAAAKEIDSQANLLQMSLHHGDRAVMLIPVIILVVACVTLAIVVVGMVQNEITTASQSDCIARLGQEQAAPERQVGTTACWVCVWDPNILAFNATSTTCNIGVPPNPRAGQLLGVSGTTNVDYTYRVWYKLWLGTTTRTCGTVMDYAPLTNAWTTQAEANNNCNRMPPPQQQAD